MANKDANKIYGKIVREMGNMNGVIKKIKNHTAELEAMSKDLPILKESTDKIKDGLATIQVGVKEIAYSIPVNL